MDKFRQRLYVFLRWSERYTKIDMIYATQNGFWVNANFVTVSFFALLLSVFFANFLTKETYGTYQYLFSVYAILTAFTLTGMNAAITQAVARGYPNTLRVSLRPQLLWNLLPATVSLAIAGYYLHAGNITIAAGLLLLGIAIPLYNAFNSYTAYLSGTEDFRGTYLYACSVNIPYYVCMFAGIYFLRNALALVAINLVLNTSITIINYARIVRRISPAAPNDAAAIPYGRRLTYANLFSTAASQIDNLLVFHFLGAADLAAYALVRLIPERLGGVFKAILAPAFPRLANRSLQEVRATILQRSLLLAIPSLALAAAYALIAPFLFSLIYSNYSSFAHYSSLYALTLLGSVGNLGATALMAQRRTRALYALNSIIPALQIIFLLIGLYWAGLLGLIIAKILGSLVMACAAIYFVNSGPLEPAS